MNILNCLSSGIALLILGATSISFSPVFVSLAHVEPSVSAFYRLVIGGLVLVPFVWAKHKTTQLDRWPFILAILCGVLFALDLAVWHQSILYVGPGLATILSNFQVFILGVVGILVLGDKASWHFLVALPLALIGLFLLVGWQWGTFGEGYKFGIICGFATAVFYSVFILLLRAAQKRKRRLAATANLCVFSLVAALLLGTEISLSQKSFSIPDMQTLLVLIALGLVCQVLGWWFISRGTSLVQTSRIGLILLLQPTLAFIWDLLLFSRPTTEIEMIGVICTLVAIYFGGVRR